MESAGVAVTHFWNRLKLRTRTAIIITLFIWITAITIGLICRSSFRLWILRQTDNYLFEDTNDFQALMDGDAIPWSKPKSDRWNRRLAIHPLHQMFIRVQDPQNHVIWESLTAPHDLPHVDPSNPNIQGIESYRLIHRPIKLWRSPEDPSSDLQMQLIPATLQVGCSILEAEAAMNQVDSWLLPAFGLLLIGTPPLALLLARWLLQPLKVLTNETEAIPVISERLVSRTGNQDEIDRLAETVNAFLERARSDMQQNEAWIADSAHQLRSPLAAIISNVEVVANRIPDGKSGQMLQKVLEECQYLRKLVNQLLLLAETNDVRRQPIAQSVRWDSLVQRSADFFDAVASEKDIRIETPRIDPCTVLANPEHLRFVIHNLIDNAIKYTPEGGRIEISVVRNPNNNRCTLTVADTGMGISPEDQERLGRRFCRINSGRDPALTPRGSGLGLSIVLNIIELLKGEFQVSSELGKGTTIRVTLPEAPPEPRA
ncbi:MAG: sensor histidine kinase [Pirellula sp.]